MKNKLEQLKEITTVVADTGDIESIRQFKPVDATTNPSLLLKAASLPQYFPLLKNAVAWAYSKGGSNAEQLSHCIDKLAVNIGLEILDYIPGRISTEVTSRLSFDTNATVDKARYLINLYNQAGISNDRILIKIASTWEGIRAAEILEKEGIQCNLTLIFSFTQAIACADAGAYLISPFVGRILDWHNSTTGIDNYDPARDPGVLSVIEIYNYYKQHSYNTCVMGASFRNKGQILELAGCDRLTISPQFLKELQQDIGKLESKLNNRETGPVIEKVEHNEPEFRWHMNENAMATEKLSEGVRNFYADELKLDNLLKTINLRPKREIGTKISNYANS